MTEVDGATSHTAIIARSLELPAVVGVEKITARVRNGDLLLIDGERGTVHINPAPSIVEEYQRKQDEQLSWKKELAGLKERPAQTKDKKRERGQRVGPPGAATPDPK